MLSVGERGLSTGLSSIQALLALTAGAIVAAFTVPIYTKAIGQSLHDECAEQILMALERTKQVAQSGRKTTAFYLDLDAERFTAAGEIGSLTLPEEASVTITPARLLDDVASAANGIVFFSDGSSTGGEIRIAYRNLVHVIAVDGSTGSVSLH
jgi:general secretion pathway protein H